MGNGVCNCSKASEQDSNMQEIAREESVSLVDKHKSSTRNGKKVRPELLQEEGEQRASPISSNLSKQKIVRVTPSGLTNNFGNTEKENEEEEDQDVIEETFIIKCESIRECEAIKRIITCLVFYQTLDIINDKHSQSRLLKYFDGGSNDDDDIGYPYLLEDYHHILSYHIGDDYNNINKSRQEFEFIYNLIMHKIKKCNIDTDDKFKRNNRLREKYSVCNNDNNNINDDMKLKYYIEMMDIIHCFFIQTFHCGYRLKISDMDETRRKRKGGTMRKSSRRRKSEMVGDDDEYQRQLTVITEETRSQILLEEDDESKLYIDEQLEKIKTKLINKQKKLKNIIGNDRYNNNKFVTKIPKYVQNNMQEKGI